MCVGELWFLFLLVMFLDGRQPVRYGLKLEIDEKYRQLKDELEKLCGVPAARLLMVEVYASNIRVSYTLAHTPAVAGNHKSQILNSPPDVWPPMFTLSSSLYSL